MDARSHTPSVFCLLVNVLLHLQWTTVYAKPYATFWQYVFLKKNKKKKASFFLFFYLAKLLVLHSHHYIALWLLILLAFLNSIRYPAPPLSVSLSFSPSNKLSSTVTFPKLRWSRNIYFCRVQTFKTGFSSTFALHKAFAHCCSEKNIFASKSCSLTKHNGDVCSARLNALRSGTVHAMEGTLKWNVGIWLIFQTTVKR